MESNDVSTRFGKDPRMLVREAHWFNSGPPPALLSRHPVTPVALFFTRNHGAVPTVDPVEYRLHVGGLVTHSLELSLDDLRRRRAERTVGATLVCAGLRRDELMAVRPVPGEVPWGAEPVSHGVWTGIPLRDVLAEAGVAEGAGHVAFSGLDEIERHGHRFAFGASIPLEKAMAPEVLLAWELNGTPLPPVHGFPLRVVVPGFIGARSVKWLGRIEVRAEPTDNYFQSHAYRMFPPGVGPDTVRWEEGRPLSDVPMNSVIWAPRDGDVVAAGCTVVRGWALASGGSTVERVEVSADDGRTWVDAALEGRPDPWAWRLWQAELDLAPGSHELAVRMWDAEGRTQPARVDALWNFKGYANNAWHRVRVEATA